MSRHIPKKVSDALKKKHFFECAWCCTTITDRHHIEEFSSGGKHTLENLILLCPTCHRQTHKGEISKEELIERKSNHEQGDRISGSIFLQAEQPRVFIGGGIIEFTPVIIEYDGTNIIEFQKLQNERFTIKTRFHDHKGRLVFWLNQSRFWATESYSVKSEKSSLSIQSNSTPQYLKINSKANGISIQGHYFLGGKILNFTESYIEFDQNRFYIRKISFCGSGIFIRH